MKLHSRKSWITFGGLVTLAALTVIGPTDRAAAAPDWKAGEQAIGKAGALCRVASIEWACLGPTSV